MKNKLALLLALIIPLTSCTIMGVEVNKGPEEYIPDGNIFSSENFNSMSSSQTSESQSSTQTSTGPIMNGLTFEQAKPIIEHIKTNINSENYQIAKHYTSKFKSNNVVIDKDSNITITIENIDSYIDFENYTYLSKDKKVANGEINKNINQYIYKQDKAESKTFYDATIDLINPDAPSKTYSLSEATSLEPSDLKAKFEELTKVKESANQDLTNIAIEAMLGLQYVKNLFKKVDITSHNDNSISFDIEYDEDLLTHMTTRVYVNILDNRLMNFKTETHPIGVAVNVNVNEYVLDYSKKDYNYPNLNDFTKI